MDWTTIATPVLQALGGVLATVITGVAVWAVKKYLGIELDKNQQAQAKQIVLSVEERAMALIKNKANRPLVGIPSGEIKHADAVAQLKELNPAMTTPEAVGQIDRAVGSLPNVGALKTPCAPLPGPIG